MWRLFTILSIVALHTCAVKPTPHSPALKALIEASMAGRSWIEAGVLLAEAPSKSERKAYADYVTAHPDRSSYLALGSLLRHDSLLASSIAVETQARVLCDALAHQTYLNDFAVLEPGDQSVRAAGKALLALGSSAAPFLRQMLSDAGPAPLFGSEEAAISSIYHYRRKDFAYYFLWRIQGRECIFEADPADRDALMRVD